MEILREITQWDVEYRQPNHTYLVNAKNQVVAYAKWHSKTDVQIFKSRHTLDKRYRKFEKVEHPKLAKIAKQFASEDIKKEKEVIKPTENVRVFNVKSKDKVYSVTFNKNTKQVVCGCIGFNYRRYCKHSEAVAKQLGV
jgi:hypothetical protein